MTLLLTGLLGWSFFHLFKSVFPEARKTLDAKLGQLPSKGLFAVLILLSLGAMISGWKGASMDMLYRPASWSAIATSALMALSLLLFTASIIPSRLRLYVRHPQLTGVFLWAVAHLLSNGELRSLVLFAGMGIWALVSMVAINHRDGAWHKPSPAGLKQDLMLVVAAAAVYLGTVFAHPWLSGVSLG